MFKAYVSVLICLLEVSRGDEHINKKLLLDNKATLMLCMYLPRDFHMLKIVNAHIWGHLCKW